MNDFQYPEAEGEGVVMESVMTYRAQKSRQKIGLFSTIICGMSLLLGPKSHAQECSMQSDATFTLLEAEHDPIYDTLFTLEEEGWLGGDIAHSIPLDGPRNLWIFGDTFVGTSTDGVRDGGAILVNGSIAIQDMTISGPESLEYAWGTDPTGYFAHQNPPSEGDYYWTTNGILLDDGLYIFAMNVVDLFTQVGTSVIHVPNWQDDPSAWIHDVTYVEVGETTRMFHSGLWEEGGYLYMMGFDDSLGFRRSVLARAEVEAVKNGLRAEDYAYWSADGTWRSDDGDMATLIELGVTESHLHYDAFLERYLYTLYDVFSGQIYLSTAESLTGPWSSAQCIYQVTDGANLPFDIVTYAARLHPELSREPGELILSYMTNSWDGLWPLFTEAGADIYRPRFVRLLVDKVEDTPPDDGGCDGGEGLLFGLFIPVFAIKRRFIHRQS